jgi:hypothetical protein
MPGVRPTRAHCVPARFRGGAGSDDDMEDDNDRFLNNILGADSDSANGDSSSSDDEDGVGSEDGGDEGEGDSDEEDTTLGWDSQPTEPGASSFTGRDVPPCDERRRPPRARGDGTVAPQRQRRRLHGSGDEAVGDGAVGEDCEDPDAHRPSVLGADSLRSSESTAHPPPAPGVQPQLQRAPRLDLSGSGGHGGGGGGGSGGGGSGRMAGKPPTHHPGGPTPTGVARDGSVPPSPPLPPPPSGGGCSGGGSGDGDGDDPPVPDVGGAAASARRGLGVAGDDAPKPRVALRPTESWARYDEDPFCDPATSEHKPGEPQWKSELKGDAAKGSTTASYFFKLMFPVALMLRVVEATNIEGRRRYAGVTQATGGRPGGRPRRPWKTVHLSTMFKFLAITIGMGIMHFGVVRHYWSDTHPVLGARKPFTDIMPGWQYERIHASLRFSLPGDEPTVRGCLLRP